MLYALGVLHKNTGGKPEKMCRATEYEMTLEIFCQGAFSSQHIPYVIPYSSCY